MAPPPPKALSENRLLAALPPADYDRILALTTVLSLAQRDVQYQVNGPMDFAYFPQSGVLSMVVVMASGAMSEVGIIGCEGLAGVQAFLGADTSPHRVFCQVPGHCRRMPMAAFRDELGRSGAFRDLVQKYALAFYFQAAQSTACNHHHPVEERCARWLLMTHDRVGADTFPITHEFLSIMLGVRRPSVTLAAGLLQKAGIIRYTRGKVTVVDRSRLEEVACECYRAVRDNLERVMDGAGAAAGFRPRGSSLHGK